MYVHNELESLSCFIFIVGMYMIRTECANNSKVTLILGMEKDENQRMDKYAHSVNITGDCIVAVCWRRKKAHITQTSKCSSSPHILERIHTHEITFFNCVDRQTRLLCGLKG